MAATDAATHLIQTSSGARFDIQNPELDIEDIAHALSNLCRFNGHVKYFYNVADHSIMVSFLMGNELEGLLHDASEAYLSDVPKPIKQLLPDWSGLEDRVDQAARDKWQLPPEMTHACHVADQTALLIEAMQLCEGFPWWEQRPQYRKARELLDNVPEVFRIKEPSDPIHSKKRFLQLFDILQYRH